MDFLVISYNFNKEASGNMTKRIVKALVQGGHKVYVLTASDVQDCDIQCNIHVCKPLLKTESVYYRLIRKLYKFFVKDSNEYHPLWMRRAVHSGMRIINENHIDFIYARSSPVEANNVGYWLGKKSSIPVIQHFSDPYPTRFVTQNSFIRRIQTKRICKVISEAFLVSYGNDEMMKQSLEEVGLKRDNRFFISPDPSEEKGFRILPKSESDKKILVYLGGFGGQRNPQPLYDAVDKLNREGTPVELRIYTERPFKNESIPDSVVFMGRQDNIDEALMGADICIDLGIKWPNSPYISSKLKDYLSINRFVLSITEGKSATQDLLQSIATVIVVPNNTESIFSSIKFILVQDNSILDYYERKKILKLFFPSNIVNNMITKILISES